METEIIVAVIIASAIILAVIIVGGFILKVKKTNGKGNQRIQGNGNIQAGKDVHISGGVTINAQSNDKRK